MSLYIIIYEGITMIFVTGLFIYHSKLIMRNTTTKEDIKSFWENPEGNPYLKNTKMANIKNALFPLKQKKSIIDFFAEGFMHNLFFFAEKDIEKKFKSNIVQNSENVLLDNLKNEELKNNDNNTTNKESKKNNENKEKKIIDNNFTNSPFNEENEKENENWNVKENVKENIENNKNSQVKNYNENDNERNISTAQITGNKMYTNTNNNFTNNNKYYNRELNHIQENVEESSNFIVNGVGENRQSIKSFDINVDLNDERMIKRQQGQNKINERYSDSLNNSMANNERRSTVRISDCSENITDSSGGGGRKVPCFHANFDSDARDIEVKPKDCKKN